MIKRWQENMLRRGMQTRRGVHLTGVRQCGKSTLAEWVSAGKMRHVSLDELMFFRSAQSDPSSFVDRPDGRSLVIDEIQKVPELLNAIKIKVDHNNEKGQYLLTGSSNLLFMKQVRDSLAGRLGTIRLRTLTLGEINGAPGHFLKEAFERNFKVEYGPFDKRAVIHRAFCGGYPESMDMEVQDRRLWFKNYLRDILVKDIKDITEIRKLAALRKVADWLLAHSTKFFEMNELAALAQISRPTADSYVEAMKALYLFDEVAQWSKSDYAKIGKRSKLVATDPALVANLLGWNEEETFYNDDDNGKLVETWVYHELAALCDLGGEYELTHYRDADKREIDFIVERDDGAMLGVEVKAGKVSDGDFKHLKWFAAHLATRPFTGIVLYSGNATVRFGEGFYAVPLGALGEV